MLPTKRFFMVILPEQITTVASAKNQRKPKTEAAFVHERKMDRAVPGRHTRSRRRARTANLEERKTYSSMIVRSCRGEGQWVSFRSHGSSGPWDPAWPVN